MPQSRPPQWRRPVGVAAGTWDYVNERSIADHYDDFVADTPLCTLDEKILHKHFPEPQNSEKQSILDLGCGTGRVAIGLAERGYDVVGVDLSQSMLEQMRAKASELPDGHHVDCVRANLVELDCLATNSLDHAICMFSTLGMVQRRKNRRQFLRHVKRIVRPGGTFILHVHNRWSAIRESGGCTRLVKSWIRSWKDNEHEFGDATYEYRGLGQMFMHRYSATELKRDLQDCQLNVQEWIRVNVLGTGFAQPYAIAGGFIVIGNC